MTATVPEVEFFNDLDFEPVRACESGYPSLPQPCGAVPVTHLGVPSCGCSYLLCFSHVEKLRERGAAEPFGGLWCAECQSYFPVGEMRFIPL